MAFLATEELSCLNGINGFMINGIAASDFSGYSVSVGDINNDTVSDVIIGAMSTDPGGRVGAGQTYVLFGSPSVGSSGTIELSNLDGSNGFILNGILDSDQSGRSVSSCDFNGDGADDVIIGARDADPNGLVSGQSYIVYGGPNVGNSGVIELSDLDGSNGFMLNGIKGFDESGWYVSTAGDFNNDGFLDAVIGAEGADPNGSSSGESYVIFGGNNVGASGTFEFSNINGTNGFTINGVAGSDRSGFWVSWADDINEDGISDILIGADDAPGGNGNGAGYLIFGGASVGASGTFELSSLSGSNGFRLPGAATNDFGGRVASAGDVNNDGKPDIIYGARAADPNALSAAGQSYVVFGGAGVGSSGTIQLSSLNGANGFKINGIVAGDYSGYSVANGDINNDSISDVIIGAERAAPNGAESGQCYVIFGKTGIGSSGTIELSDLDGSNGFKLNGIAADSRTGNAVTSGDINNDGIDDVIIGANRADGNGVNSGQTYVVFGGSSIGCPTVNPTASPTTSSPTMSPIAAPTSPPTQSPTISPTTNPTLSPSLSPTMAPTNMPTASPTVSPTLNPTKSPTSAPTSVPTASPVVAPSSSPTFSPTMNPTQNPTLAPVTIPTVNPTLVPTMAPSLAPTINPTMSPMSPTINPTVNPTSSPIPPTMTPTSAPTVMQQTSPATKPSSPKVLGVNNTTFYAIVGGVGGVCLIGLLALSYYFYRKKNPKQQTRLTSDYDEGLSMELQPVGDFSLADPTGPGLFSKSTDTGAEEDMSMTAMSNVL